MGKFENHAFGNDGVIEIKGTIDDVENSNNTVDIKNVNQKEADLLLPFKINPTLDDVKPVNIGNYEEFNVVKSNVLKSNYVCLFKRNNLLSMVTDIGHYYIVDTEKVPFEEISKLLVFRKPKKILFDMREYKELINENSTGFWDLKLIMKILWRIELHHAKEILQVANIPAKGKKNVFLFCTNLINIAKEINIYIEINKLNQYLLLELDIAKEAIICESKGIPIDINKYNEHKIKIQEEFNKIIDNIKIVYGDGLNFNNMATIFNYLYEKGKVPSLEPTILFTEDEKLYNDISIFNEYKELEKHLLVNSNIVVTYDTYRDYEIKVNFIPDLKRYLDKSKLLIEGQFNDLYLRILTELTKDKMLIEATSTNQFLKYLNENILENEKLGIYSEIFIRAYANKCFDTLTIQAFAETYYHTAISEKDINYINKLFKDKAPNLINFFIKFNGNDVIYERYNNKLFHPSSNLDAYIKQIMNLVFKSSISYVKSAIFEYNSKYRNDDTTNIEILSFYDHKIILLSSNKSKSVAIDILNRYMSFGYKKFIKNTKYYNVTSIITNKEATTPF